MLQVPWLSKYWIALVIFWPANSPAFTDPVTVAFNPFDTVVSDTVEVFLLFHVIFPANGPAFTPVRARPLHVAALLAIDADSVPLVTPPPLQPDSVSLIEIVTLVALGVMPGLIVAMPVCFAQTVPDAAGG